MEEKAVCNLRGEEFRDARAEIFEIIKKSAEIEMHKLSLIDELTDVMRKLFVVSEATQDSTTLKAETLKDIMNHVYNAREVGFLFSVYKVYYGDNEITPICCEVIARCAEVESQLIKSRGEFLTAN